MKKKQGKKSEPQYFRFAREVLESPALPVLGISARRCLDRIMLEYLRHAGRDNGKLPITYKQFEKYGVCKHEIARALCELEALGFIKITRGRGGNAEYRHPSLFWITFLLGGTGEYRQFKTAEEAKAAASKARGKRKKHAPPKNRNRPTAHGAVHPTAHGAKTTISRPTAGGVKRPNSRPTAHGVLSRKDLSTTVCDRDVGSEPVPSPAVVLTPRRGNGAVPEVEVYLERWLTDCCVADPAASTRGAELLNASRAWAKCNGRMNGAPILEQDLVKVLAAKGYGHFKSRLGVVFSGIRLS